MRLRIFQIEVFKSQHEENSKENKIFTENETDLLNKQKDLEQMLNAKTEEAKSLNENSCTQHIIIEDQDKMIIVLQEGIITAEASHEELKEVNNNNQEELKTEIIELKEIKTEMINLMNIKQELNGQEFVKQEESFKQQLVLREKEVKELKEEILVFEKELLFPKFPIGYVHSPRPWETWPP